VVEPCLEERDRERSCNRSKFKMKGHRDRGRPNRARKRQIEDEMKK